MFVQVIQGRAKDPAGLRKQFQAWDNELRPRATGFLGSTAGVSDDGEFIALARFESEEAARANSDSPEQAGGGRRPSSTSRVKRASTTRPTSRRSSTVAPMTQGSYRSSRERRRTAPS